MVNFFPLSKALISRRKDSGVKIVGMSHVERCVRMKPEILEFLIYSFRREIKTYFSKHLLELCSILKDNLPINLDMFLNQEISLNKIQSRGINLI